MKGITKRWIRLFLTATTLTTALIALSGCSINAEGKIDLSMPKKSIDFEPHDEIKNDDIQAYTTKIIINNNCLNAVSPTGTGSMKPVMGVNSTLLMKKTECVGDLKQGDIIYFNDNTIYDKPVVHRIIEITNINNTPHYKVKGDNNGVHDGLITRDKIKYLVIGIIY